jgi:5-methylcytosine-specific restriction protein A
MAKLAMLKPRVATLDTSIAALPPKTTLPFYSTPEWLAMRDRVRREASWKCQAPGCNGRGVYVDHIRELKDGGAPLDRRNLQLLCAPCHGSKTARVRAERTRAGGGSNL